MAAVANVAINVDSRGASQKLREVANRSKEVEKAVNKKNKSLSKSKREFQKQGKAAGTASYNIQRFGVALRSTLAPLVAATAAIGFLNRALNVTAERQADAELLASGLRKIGASAGDLERFQKIASDIGEQTLFNQEDFTQGFALLTSFRGIGQDSFERVSRAAADMAATTKQDVNSSLLQMAKALENPVQGLSAMSRSGTTFTEQQKNVVKALVATNRTLDAQNFILSVVEDQYKGNAQAAAQGLAGAQDTLTESFRDFNEVVGKIMLDPAIAATNLMTDAVKFLTSELTQTKEAFDILLPRIGRLFSFLTPLEGLFRNLSGTIDDFKNALIGTIPGLGGAITMLRGLKQLRDAIIGSGGDDMSVDLRPDQGADMDMDAIRRQAFQADLIKKFGNFRTPKTGKSADKLERQLAAGKELRVQFERQNQLLSTSSSLQQSLLQIEFDRLDAIKRIQETAAASQQQELIGLANATAKAEKLKEIERFAESELKAADDLIKATYGQIEAEKRREELISEGIDPALADELVKIEQTFDAVKEKLDLRVLDLEAQLATVKATSEEAKKLQEVIDKIKEKQKLLGQVEEDAKDNAKGKSEDENAEEKAEKLKKIMEDLRDNAIASVSRALEDALVTTIEKAITGAEDLGESLKAIASNLLGDLGRMFIRAGLQGLMPVPGRAVGGPVQSNGTYLVGERGPELLSIGNQSGYVHRNTSEAMDRYRAGESSGGGSRSLNVNYNVTQINGMNFVTEEQFRAGMTKAAKDGAKMGEAGTFKSMRNSRSSRARVGL